MRSTHVFVLLSAIFAGPAGASELQVVCPPLVRDGITDLAAAYTKQTGVTVAVRADVMGKIMGDIETGAPTTDVVLLPPDLMDDLVKNNGVRPGTRTPLGRVEIALAVRSGAPHPDISTVEKLRAVLLGAKMLAYTQPGPPRNSMEAGIIDRILHRPEFSGIHTMTVTSGSGISALAKGDSDLALQVIPEITAQKGTEVVGPLPPELGAHIDTVIAISARSTDAANAAAFIRYVTRPEAATTWKRFGLDR
jgi:molybdate transport system substrate-binding protein